jgi:hypothetical protein
MSPQGDQMVELDKERKECLRETKGEINMTHT